MTGSFARGRLCGDLSDTPSIFNRLFSLQGKSALVTGGSGGIGRALAVALSEAGAAVAVHGRDEQDLEETRRQIKSAGGRAVTLRAELADVDACRKLVAATVKQLG